MKDQNFHAMSSYVLITPVRDEADYLPKTIASVVTQTILPTEWVIVSDGSRDGTDDIVRQASETHPWIRLLPLARRPGRCFSAVVHNTETGIRNLICRDYRYIGLLDSDVKFQSDYFEELMRRFDVEHALGLGGGVVIDVGHPRDRFPRNRIDVPGAVQFFRRECFEKIGSLLPIPEGGWDMITCAMARMNGYQTRLFNDLVVDHLKPRNVSQGGVVKRKWQLGLRDYATGYHPLFEAVKCASRFMESPFIIGAIAWWIGYCGALLSRRKRVLPTEVLRYVRSEQMDRLSGLMRPFTNSRWD